MKNRILETLSRIVKNDLISFHVPGHKLGRVYDKLGYKDIVTKLYKMDTTEIPGTDNLHSAQGIINKSQLRASKVFDSDHTYYLVNGTTCGIHGAIMSICNPKDKVIVNRDCHKSVINGCIVADVDLVYIKTQVDRNTNVIYGVNELDVIETINNNKDAKAILLTYPTYYGMVYDLKYICEYAHINDMVVIVDEAHGAHLGMSDYLPDTAIRSGADIVVQSTHKTLPALTQASMIHIKGDRIDKDRLLDVLSMIESSSPSYVLLSSLELAVDIYEKYGSKLMNSLLMEIDKFKDSYKDNNYIDIILGDDKTKIFITFKDIGLTGYELEAILSEKYNIQVELSNYYGILLICTIGNENQDFVMLNNALKIIIKESKSKNKLKEIDYPINTPIQLMKPRRAFYSKKSKVKIRESIGLISGEYIIPYPPGICLIAPGEEITSDIIEYVLKCYEEGMNINGIEDKNLEYIKVIDK